MSDEWSEGFEPGGITLGPEDRLEREIAKSKALKVERLQLRDRISRLEKEVEDLGQENRELAEQLAQVSVNYVDSRSEDRPESFSGEAESAAGNCWVLGGIVVGLIASVLLLARWALS